MTTRLRGTGGRRFGGSHAPPPTTPGADPGPAPLGLSPAEVEAWDELRPQVVAARTYSPSRRSSFRLTVKALAMVYAAPPTLKLTSMRSLIEQASKLLARFGLDPVGALQADAPVDTRTAAQRVADALAEEG